MKLISLEIENVLNFKNKITIPFNFGTDDKKDPMLLIGHNNIGKSNIIRVLQAICEYDLMYTRSELQIVLHNSGEDFGYKLDKYLGSLGKITLTIKLLKDEVINILTKSKFDLKDIDKTRILPYCGASNNEIELFRTDFINKLAMYGIDEIVMDDTVELIFLPTISTEKTSFTSETLSKFTQKLYDMYMNKRSEHYEKVNIEYVVNQIQNYLITYDVKRLYLKNIHQCLRDNILIIEQSRGYNFLYENLYFRRYNDIDITSYKLAKYRSQYNEYNDIIKVLPCPSTCSTMALNIPNFKKNNITDKFIDELQSSSDVSLIRNNHYNDYYAINIKNIESYSNLINISNMLEQLQGKSCFDELNNFLYELFNLKIKIIKKDTNQYFYKEETIISDADIIDLGHEKNNRIVFIDAKLNNIELDISQVCGSVINVLTIIVPLYYTKSQEKYSSYIFIDEIDLCLDKINNKKLVTKLLEINKNVNFFIVTHDYDLISLYPKNTFVLHRKDDNTNIEIININDEYFYSILRIFNIINDTILCNKNKKIIIVEGIIDYYFWNMLLNNDRYVITYDNGKNTIARLVKFLLQFYKQKNIFVIYDFDLGKDIQGQIDFRHLVNIEPNKNQFIILKENLEKLVEPIDSLNYRSEKGYKHKLKHILMDIYMFNRIEENEKMFIGNLRSNDDIKKCLERINNFLDNKTDIDVQLSDEYLVEQT